MESFSSKHVVRHGSLILLDPVYVGWVQRGGIQRSPPGTQTTVAGISRLDLSYSRIKNIGIAVAAAAISLQTFVRHIESSVGIRVVL